MARNKITDTVQDNEELANLPRLTPHQQKYVEARLRGLDRNQALRAAKDVSKWKQGSIWRRAHEYEHNPKIQQWLASIRTAGVEAGLYNLEAHLAELDQIAREAKAAGNYGAAQQAIHNKGKATGMYIEQVRDVTEDADIAVLLDQVEELAGPEARRAAARKLGVPEPDPVPTNAEGNTLQ